MTVQVHPGQRRWRTSARRSLAAVLVLCCAAACGSETDGSAAPMSILTVTATVTVTQTVGDQAPVSEDPDSSAPTITPRQKNPDPCKLLTRSEATTLAGMALQAAIGAGSENGVNTLCTYTRDPYAGGTAQVSIGVGDGAKKTLDIDKDNLKHKFAKVPDIGDEAWQEDGAIFLRKGTVWVTIAPVLLNDPADNVKPLQQAAKIAASRF